MVIGKAVGDEWRVAALAALEQAYCDVAEALPAPPPGERQMETPKRPFLLYWAGADNGSGGVA